MKIREIRKQINKLEDKLIILREKEESLRRPRKRCTHDETYICRYDPDDFWDNRICKVCSKCKKVVSVRTSGMWS